MQTTTEVLPPVNMNVFINNFININTNAFDSKASSLKSFQQTQEKAKPDDYFKKIKTGTSSEPKTEPSSQETSPKASIIVSETFQTQEKAQVQPVISMKKQSDIYEPREEPFENSNVTQIIGIVMLVIAAVLFIGFFYSILAAPLIGETSHLLLDFINKDSHYCCLIPLLIPTSLIFMYANWVSIKFFRHS